MPTRTTQRALVLSGGGGRGAYQAGVWRYLEERKWSPDLVAGTSVGSLNAVAIAGGWSAQQISEFWQRVDRRMVYRGTVWRRLVHRFQVWLGRPQEPTSLLDPSPLRGVLEEMVDLERLRKGPTEVVVTAVNLVTARLRHFDQSVITVDHLMASCAIPVVFPWQVLDGQPHWDGGVMANTPLLPALQSDAREIVVILLAPLLGPPAPLPRTRYQALEWALELATLGSAETALAQFAYEAEASGELEMSRREGRQILDLGGRRLALVAPRETLGLRSVLRFDSKESKRLLEQGYEDAREQLEGLFA